MLARILVMYIGCRSGSGTLDDGSKIENTPRIQIQLIRKIAQKNYVSACTRNSDGLIQI